MQQLTREGNIRRRSRNADPIGDMQMTRWMQDRTLVTYCAKMLTFVGGIRFLWQSTLRLVERQSREGGEWLANLGVDKPRALCLKTTFCRQ